MCTYQLIDYHNNLILLSDQKNISKVKLKSAIEQRIKESRGRGIKQSSSSLKDRVCDEWSFLSPCLVSQKKKRYLMNKRRLSK